MKLHPVLRERVLPATAAVVVLGAIGVAGWYGYSTVANRPVSDIRFTGDVDRLPREVLAEFSDELRKRSSGTSLASIRENARRIPWVREAAVRRVFPDAIEVRFEAYTALARWNDAQLVSPAGEIFRASTQAPLPTLRGPDASAASVVATYPQLVEALAAIGSPIAEVQLSARGAWSVLLASGLRIVVGREELVTRARRFAAAWPQVLARGVETKYADLRYPNGFALRQTTPSTAPDKKK
jgi:cell division protein FtsQ